MIAFTAALAGIGAALLAFIAAVSIAPRLGAPENEQVIIGSLMFALLVGATTGGFIWVSF